MLYKSSSKLYVKFTLKQGSAVLYKKHYKKRKVFAGGSFKKYCNNLYKNTILNQKTCQNKL